MMPARIYLDKQSPSVFRALTGTARELRARAAEAGIDRSVLELVNVRVSQINRCAYCLDRHTRIALDGGETPQRLAVLPAWRETTLFSSLEQAALEIAEAVTLVADAHLDDEAYTLVREHLSDNQLSLLTWAAITINAFNRVSILSGHPVGAHATPRPAATARTPGDSA
jgi:AhpD family alkylhydroperoxidase